MGSFFAIFYLSIVCVLFWIVNWLVLFVGYGFKVSFFFTSVWGLFSVGVLCCRLVALVMCCGALIAFVLAIKDCFLVWFLAVTLQGSFVVLVCLYFLGFL